MVYDFIQLDRNIKKPLCNQIYEEIKKAVESGIIKKGEKLPSIRTAANDLNVSSTTVENAYIRLYNEGYVESKPQSGYFVQIPIIRKNTDSIRHKSPKVAIKYDFSSGKIDEGSADTVLWKKYIRAALNNQSEITSYGEPQGEEVLRKAISEYVYTARRVAAKSENIVIGAGTQFLLTLFCSLYPKRTTIAMEFPGFKQAERIFKDFGFKVVYLDTKTDKTLSEQLEDSEAEVFLYIPSNYPKQSICTEKKQREELIRWVNSKKERLILEDDYNGELRYTARPIPAMQGFDCEKILYLGSFSKLLLPSVRIAYMVLPNMLMNIYKARISDYNSTASKIEQIALSEYIKNGHLEKHLRRLKKLYYKKSQKLYNELKTCLKSAKQIYVLDASLIIIVKLDTKLSDFELLEKTEKQGIRVDSIKNSCIRLSFAGIPFEDIQIAVKELSAALDI